MLLVADTRSASYLICATYHHVSIYAFWGGTQFTLIADLISQIYFQSSAPDRLHPCLNSACSQPPRTDFSCTPPAVYKITLDRVKT